MFWWIEVGRYVVSVSGRAANDVSLSGPRWPNNVALRDASELARARRCLSRLTLYAVLDTTLVIMGRGREGRRIK